LKYGTLDAEYFRLPNVPISDDAPARLRLLDDNLRHIRELSNALQLEIIEERKRSDIPAAPYAVGDLILFNPREKPDDFLPTKLSPAWLGPYRVTNQHRNDITCEHIVTKDVKVFHTSRVKPYFGEDNEEAYKAGMVDKDQHQISVVSHMEGNVFVRKSLLFNVIFEDGDAIMLPYAPDISETEQFVAFINSKPYLYPLRFTSAALTAEKKRLNAQPLDQRLTLGSTVYLHLRYFDGVRLSWYDRLGLDKGVEYLVKVRVRDFVNDRRTKMNVVCEYFDNREIMLTPFLVYMYILYNTDLQQQVDYVVIDDSQDEQMHALLAQWRGIQP
jgi:hypothetical protein